MKQDAARWEAAHILRYYAAKGRIPNYEHLISQLEYDMPISSVRARDAQMSQIKDKEPA